MNGDTGRPKALKAFSGIGIELEYMIVERGGLSVLPIADQVLRTDTDAHACEVDRGLLGWSNELALHVLEIKNQRPAASTAGLVPAFQSEVRYLNRLLELYDARLMPTAMHPWMNPERETRLWPHGHADLYATYARIFDCRSHGWSNLQSMHVNLPFAGDTEFGRLHAAVRLLLPVLPALAASSPIADGAPAGAADFRMQAYRGNAGGFGSIAGAVIPETVSSREEYEERILAPMYREIAPHDPQGALQHEWLNSRGAIARFDRSAIEIRVLDTQECPQADLAIAAVVFATAAALFRAGGSASALRSQQAADTGLLADILGDCIRDAEQAVIADAAYLALLDYPGSRCSARDLWRHLSEEAGRAGALDGEAVAALRVILEQGTLARRILRAVGPDCERHRLRETYRVLCRCLDEGTMFVPS